MDDEAAAARTRNLRIVRLPPRGARFGLTLLKTAAVLALGVLLGRYLPEHGRQSAQPPKSNSPIAAVRVDGFHPRWLDLAGRLGSEPASLADQLTLLAASRRQ